MNHKKALLFVIILAIFGGSLFAKSTLLNFLYDMFNQVSIKPQEPGSMTTFPIGTVSTTGQINEDPSQRFDWLIREVIPETSTVNPIPITEESLSNGRLNYETYCATCHGKDKSFNEAGLADTKVNQLGMIAPTLLLVSHTFGDGYIFHKIYYGGAVMPSLGYATTATDRWDIVNYIRYLEKQ